jgi:hypothetical protein
MVSVVSLGANNGIVVLSLEAEVQQIPCQQFPFDQRINSCAFCSCLHQQPEQMDDVMPAVVQMQRHLLWRPTHIHNGSAGNRCHRGCVVEEMLSHCLQVSSWRSGWRAAA